MGALVLAAEGPVGGGGSVVGVMEKGWEGVHVGVLFVESGFVEMVSILPFIYDDDDDDDDDDT